MTQLIVRLYHSAIGFIFGMGILAAIIVLSASGFPHGLLGALTILLGTVLLTGISAVLLSINDHLAALRERRD